MPTHSAGKVASSRLRFLSGCVFSLLCLLVVLAISILQVPRIGALVLPKPMVAKTYVQHVQLPGKVDLTHVTSWDQSTFAINLSKSKRYYVNDRLNVTIVARDGTKRNKTSGGDYFRARIFNEKLKAGASSDGEVIDHGNGVYTALFTLRWSGNANIDIRLVHPAEAVAVLRRARDEASSRCGYTGRFERLKGNTTIKAYGKCNIFPPTPHHHNQTLCDYTDKRTSNPWFCLQPTTDNFTCSDLRWTCHNSTWSKSIVESAIYPKEKIIFKSQKNYVTPASQSYVIVEPSPTKNLPVCRPGVHRGYSNISSGYFLKGTWYSNHCKVRNFHIDDTLRCLTNKTVYIQGDSTCRQYYEYLVKHIPSLQQDPPTKQSNWKVGPSVAYDRKHNFEVHYRHHGQPVRNNWTNFDETHYIVNELDSLEATADTVFMFGVWAHFTATNLTLYEHVMRGIRHAVERLHQRSPETLVLLKSANTRQHKGYGGALMTSDWYARDLDLKMREIFLDYDNIAFIDQWAMTTGHSNPDNIHPNENIIEHGIRTLLSSICPVG